jgi:hypothetical protein
MALQNEIRELQIILMRFQLRLDVLMQRLLNELGTESDEDDDPQAVDTSTEYTTTIPGTSPLFFAHIELEDDLAEQPDSPQRDSGKYRKR